MEAFPRALEHVGSQVLSPCLRAVSHTWWEKHPSELAPATNKASAQLKMCTFAGRPEERKVMGATPPLCAPPRRGIAARWRSESLFLVARRPPERGVLRLLQRPWAHRLLREALCHFVFFGLGDRPFV